MHVLIAHDSPVPVARYGGTERLVWWLGRELVRRGHRLTYLLPAGSHSPFAEVRALNRERPLAPQIPAGVDVVHSFFPLDEPLPPPHLATVGGNGQPGERFAANTVFVSRDHARRHGARAFVHNAIDPADYGEPDLDRPRQGLLFLAKARWRVKNLAGAKAVARRANLPLAIAGGRGWSPRPGVRYHGMVGGTRKLRLLQDAGALVFPVRWHEPFGIALIEALYFGCPVLGTPYGSLPELIPPEVGKLSADGAALAAVAAEAAAGAGRFDRGVCHAHVRERFTIGRMADDYLTLYQRVRDGEALNPSPPRTLEPGVPDGGLLPFTR